MTTTPETEPVVDASGAWETSRVDAALSGRNMTSAVFLKGLLDNGQLATVGRPDRLPQDLFPHVDPDVVQAIWDRALAVGLHAGRVSASPRLHRDQMLRVQGEFERIGFEAMARSVGRSLRLVAPHPADGEGARARGCGVTKGPDDTGEGT